jgi:hypothetical protein
MDEPKAASLSPAEAEEFRAGGEDGRQAKAERQPGTFQHLSMEAIVRDPRASCCVGVDEPGVGRVHSADCPRLSSPWRSGREYAADEVPQPLWDFVDGATFTDRRCSVCGARRLVSGACSLVSGGDGMGGCPDPLHDYRLEETARCERILAQLPFAARDLAERNLRGALSNAGVGGHVIASSCTECRVVEHLGVLRHSGTCRTGRVLDLIAELLAIPEFDLNKKEVASEEGMGSSQQLKPVAGDPEQDRAGDGIRPRGTRLKALRAAALEEMAELPGRLTWQCNVCGSSVTGLDKTARDIAHGCDCWVGNTLVVLESAHLEGGAQ